MRKRSNASLWEEQTNECTKYLCDNSSGFVRENICNSDDETSRICIEGKCIENKTVEEEGWIVEIEVEGINSRDFNTTELAQHISTISAIDSEEITIGIEADEDGQVIRILIFVGDEDKANSVETSVKRILGRNVKNTRIIAPELTVSNSYHSVPLFILLSFLLCISIIP